jgi:two-component system, response regulator
MITDVKTILIAEDDANDLELTLEALRQHHVANQIVAVRDGVEAIDYLERRGRFADRRNGLPVFVLLDLKMPKVDGMEVLRHIRSSPHLRNIPVVLLTSSREEQDLAHSYELGVNAYVVKPVDFNEFMEAVRQIGGFWAVLNEVPRTAGV